jgi:hypothetical protein
VDVRIMSIGIEPQPNSNVTRTVYRHQISDTVTRAPAALDQALAAGGEQA